MQSTSLKYFTDRVGKTVLRNNRPFYIKNVRYAWYLYKIRDYFTFEDVDSEEKPMLSMVNYSYDTTRHNHSI